MIIFFIREFKMLVGIKKIFFLIICITVSFCSNAQEQNVRNAGVSGAFYPNDPKALSSMVDGFLENAEIPSIEGTIYGFVAPHAGYVYSGHVAGHTYAFLQNRDIEKVIVISPSHVEGFRGASIYNGDAYKTPLGEISVDKDFCKELAAKNDLLFYLIKVIKHLCMVETNMHLKSIYPFFKGQLKNFNLFQL